MQTGFLSRLFVGDANHLLHPPRPRRKREHAQKGAPLSIVLIAIGRVEPETLTVLQAGIGAVLRCPVLRRAATPEPVYAFDTRRHQYLVSIAESVCAR